jgi:glycosyltransferase involved in cell wall biosynthesis
VSPARLILHTEASLGFGGQELRIVTESRWLLDHGWDVLIAGQPGSRLLDESRRQGVPAVAVRMRRVVDPPALLALRRLIAARNVALVHTHSSVDSWLAGLAARSLRRRLVRSRHVTIAISRRRSAVYRLAHRIISSGEAAARVVAASGVPAARIVPVPPGVDTTRFHPGLSGAAVRAELGLGDAPVVGLVANIRGSKGHDVFLEAARAVLARAPAARFLIVGDGIGFDDVRRRVGALGLDTAVQMTGFRRDVPEVMAALDVLVLPSIRSEAASQVIPQALAGRSRSGHRPPRPARRPHRPGRGDPRLPRPPRAGPGDGPARPGPGPRPPLPGRLDGPHDRGVPRAPRRARGTVKSETFLHECARRCHGLRRDDRRG